MRQSRSSFASANVDFATGPLSDGSRGRAVLSVPGLEPGHQTRLSMFGIETDPAQIDQRVQAAVKLFLNGIRPRSNE
jgi:hypothetical protein